MLDLDLKPSPARPRGGAAVPPDRRTVKGPEGMYEPRWPNSKAMKVGYLTGLGRTARDIAEELADGTSVNTIRAQWRRHSIVDRSKLTTIPVELGGNDLSRLSAAARRQGIAPEVWLERLLKAAIRDDLYEAVVDESP